MKLSIFTPTHNTKYLKELEETILNQTHTDWEWIILLNNGASYEASDLRIRIIQSTKNTTKIGALKKEACKYASGDVLVEVDHDDLITSDCLEEINKAFMDEETGFVYSDNAKLSNTFIPYNPSFGWTYSTFYYKGLELIRMHSLPLTPHNISYIWFAPDHIRAWRKTTYDNIGGHDEDMNVCDDHDLIIRTYLITKFKFINKCLYIYRIQEDNNNTWKERNNEIQETTKKLHDKYLWMITNRYYDINNKRKEVRVII